METFQLNNDISVFYVTAKSFPDGVMAAYDALREMLPKNETRTFFGISRPDEKGIIVYKAAVEEKYEGEGKEHGCETFIIKQGTYLTETIYNWKKKMEMFQVNFNKLIADQRMDTDFPCIEWYDGDDKVVCMVRLDDAKRNNAA